MSNTPVRAGMPLEEFIRQHDQQPFELIDGERIVKMPSVALHGRVIQVLFLALYLCVTERKLGQVFQEMTFILPDRNDADWVKGSRTPDVLFYAGSRVADYKARTPDWQQRPIRSCPIW